jgi:hypothetical protein
VSRQPRVVALGDAEDAERQVGLRQPGLEEILEEVAQVGRRRLVPVRHLARCQLLQEGDDSGGLDRLIVDVGLAEAEVEESVGEAPAMPDRPLAQTTVLTQIGFVITAQIAPCLVPCRQRRRRHPDHGEVICEAPPHEGCILLPARAPSVGENEVGGDPGRDGLQIDAALFDDAAQLADDPEIEVDRAMIILSRLECRAIPRR